MTLRISKPTTFKRNQKITAKNVLRYDPSYLFKNNEVGVWYDPSDLSTMSQTIGGLPVTGMEQPVGLILDKSKGLELGPELVVNGSFDSDSGWTLQNGAQIVNGELILGGSDVSFRTISAVPGKWYKVTLDITVLVSSVYIDIVNSPTYSSTLNAANSINGIISLYVLATGTNLYVSSSFGSSSAVVRSVSVKEILGGNHAYQTTSASRPVLSARYNLLTRTEQFDYAAWTQYSGSITNNSILDPLGGTTACEFTSSGTNAAIASTNMISVSANTNYTFSVWLRVASGTNTTQIGITYSGLGSIQSTSVQVTTAWQRFSISGSVGAETSVRVSIGGNLSIGNGVVMYIWGADLRPTNEASTLPPYQRVGNPTAGSSTTAGVADYDTVGFPPYLRFDGVDDFLVTDTINPGSVDKAQVFTGIRKLSDPGDQAALETSVGASFNNGAISLFAPVSAQTNYNFGSRGTIFRSATASGFAAPTTNVITGLSDISGDIVIIRVNGTQFSTSALDQGTENYLSYPLYIGRRGGTSLPFNGRIYSLVLRFSSTNLDTNRLLNTEKWVSGKTGIPYTVNIDRVLSEILFDRSENTIEDVRNSTIVSKR